RFPATCFMMTAMQLVLGSRATCSLASGSWATALSAHPLLEREAARAPSIRAFATSFDSDCAVVIVSLDQKLPGDISSPAVWRPSFHTRNVGLTPPGTDCQPWRKRTFIAGA